MDFFSSLRISASGLSAQQTRMNTISSNIANAESTSPNGPYKRKDPVFCTSNKYRQVRYKRCLRVFRKILNRCL